MTSLRLSKLFLIQNVHPPSGTSNQINRILPLKLGRLASLMANGSPMRRILPRHWFYELHDILIKKEKSKS